MTLASAGTSFAASLRHEKVVLKARQLTAEVEDEHGASPLTSPASRSRDVRRSLIRNEGGIFLTDSGAAGLHDAVTLLNNLKSSRWRPRPLTSRPCPDREREREQDKDKEAAAAPELILKAGKAPLTRSRSLRQRPAEKAEKGREGGHPKHILPAAAAKDDESGGGPGSEEAVLPSPSESDEDFPHELSAASADISVQLSQVALQGAWDISCLATPTSPGRKSRRVSHTEFVHAMNPPPTLEQARQAVASLCVTVRDYQAKCRQKVRIKNAKVRKHVEENGRLLDLYTALQAKRNETEEASARHQAELRSRKEEWSRERIGLEGSLQALQHLLDQSEARREGLAAEVVQANKQVHVLTERLRAAEVETEKKAEATEDLVRLKTIQQQQLTRRVAELESVLDEGRVLCEERRQEMLSNEETLHAMSAKVAEEKQRTALLRRWIARREVRDMARYDLDASIAFCLSAVRTATRAPTPSGIRKHSAASPRSAPLLTLDFTPIDIAPLPLGVDGSDVGDACQALMESVTATYNDLVNTTHARFSQLWQRARGNKLGKPDEVRRSVHDALRDYLQHVQKAKTRLQEGLHGCAGAIAEALSSCVSDSKLRNIFSVALRRLAEAGHPVDMVGFRPPSVDLMPRDEAAVDKFVSRMMGSQTQQQQQQSFAEDTGHHTAAHDMEPEEAHPPPQQRQHHAHHHHHHHHHHPHHGAPASGGARRPSAQQGVHDGHPHHPHHLRTQSAGVRRASTRAPQSAAHRPPARRLSSTPGNAHAHPHQGGHAHAAHAAQKALAGGGREEKGVSPRSNHPSSLRHRAQRRGSAGAMHVTVGGESREGSSDGESPFASQSSQGGQAVVGAKAAPPYVLLGDGQGQGAQQRHSLPRGIQQRRQTETVGLTMSGTGLCAEGHSDHPPSPQPFRAPEAAGEWRHDTRMSGDHHHGGMHHNRGARRSLFITFRSPEEPFVLRSSGVGAEGSNAAQPHHSVFFNMP